MPTLIITLSLLVISGYAVTAICAAQRQTILAAQSQLLTVLRYGPGTGLELARRVFVYYQVNLGQSVLYPALRGLEREGLVDSRDDHSGDLSVRGDRPRRLYWLKT